MPGALIPRTLRHGGDLTQARARYGGGDWQDLSTGISPWPWPVPALPETVWQRLPEGEQTLCRAAADYYGTDTDHVLPLPGSQFGIARLPHQVSPGRVALPEPGYAEHARAWRMAGHRPVYYHNLAELEALVDAGAVEHAVILNPNNPTAERLPRDRFRDWLSRVPKGGVVLVDEAFADLTSDASAVPLLNEYSCLWVLRSVGKFFGLAGLRLGFLLGRGALSDRLRTELTPWGVSHPAQWLGAKALKDLAWQQRQRRHLQAASSRLETIWRDFLDSQSLQPGSESPRPDAKSLKDVSLANGGLFVTLRGPEPVLEALHAHLAGHLIWLRLGGEGRQWLRCGLPPDGGERLQVALAHWLDSAEALNN